MGNAFAGRNPISLTARDVAECVGDLGEAYETYKPRIISNGLSGRILADFTDDDLNTTFKELGITSEIHKKVLMMHTKDLKQASASPQSVLTSSPSAIPSPPTTANAKKKGRPPKILAPPAPPSRVTHAFFTYDWSINEDGSNNHEICKMIAANLKAKGLIIWFDEDEMHGDIRQAVADGIDNTSCVVVFITKRYVEKVGSGNTSDNCCFEFKCAHRKFLLAVVMEDRMMENPASWMGIVGGAVGGNVFINMTEHKNPAVFEAKCDELASRIRQITDRVPSLWYTG